MGSGVFMGLEYLGGKDIGGYKLRSIRTDSKTKLYQPKSFTEVWPGSREIFLADHRQYYIGPISASHARNLTAPGTKRLYYLENVWMPWKIKRHMNILFGYQIESTGKIYFLIESPAEIAAVIKKSANSTWKFAVVALVLFFPVSLLFWSKLFGNPNAHLMKAPEFSDFQAFVGQNYLKKD
jgi:hypothetical protein